MFEEWSELCAKDDLRTPGVDDVELKAAADSVGERRRRRRKRSVAKDTVQVVKEEHEHEELVSLKAFLDIDAEEVELTVPPRLPSMRTTQTSLDIAHLPVPPPTLRLPQRTVAPANQHKNMRRRKQGVHTRMKSSSAISTPIMIGCRRIRHCMTIRLNSA